MGTVAYKPLSLAEQIFKDLIWTPILKGGEIALEGAVPFLALPVVKQLDEFAIEEFTDWVFSQVVLFVDVTSIRIVNAEHQAAYTTAFINLQVIAHDKGITSPDFLEARENAKASLNKFVRFSPTAS